MPALLALLVFFATGCRREPAQAGVASQATALPGQVMLRSELFFGRGKPGGGVVSDEEWDGFLAAEVTPAFPEGLTVLEAQGQWRNGQGRIVKEPSKVLVLFHEDSPARREALGRIVAAYKKKFNQESVLRMSERVHVEF